MLRRTLVLVVLAAAALAGAPPARLPQIEAAVRAEMARYKIPGLSAAIGAKNRLIWSDGFGMADLENGIPAKAHTVYRLGSISKPITAVAVMQLARKGRLDLDAPIQKYVPSFPEKQWTITARLLLAHLAGIRHYAGPAEMDSTRHYTDLIGPLKIFQADPLVAEPGTHYSYSTYGYLLLGAAVERAAGVKYLDYIQQRVFRPAGMDTARVDDVYPIIPHRARGYRLSKTSEWENCSLADTSNKIPGGGLVSTAGDLVKFASAVDRGALLDKDGVAAMFTNQRTHDGKPVGYGLGWRIMEPNGEKWVAHSGAQQGVSTFLLLLPGRGLSVALMANREGLNLAALAVRIASLAQ